MKDKEISIYVPEGSGDNGYHIKLRGTRSEILKAICNIYGGHLSMYNYDDWKEKGEVKD